MSLEHAAQQAGPIGRAARDTDQSEKTLRVMYASGLISHEELEAALAAVAGGRGPVVHRDTLINESREQQQ